ncbi:MAG TPA: molecular chaperone DnaK, partial [Solirubrobacterales bacterium]
KVDDSTKDDVKAAVKDVRDSLEAGSKEELDAKVEALNTAMTKASEQIYAAASAEQAAGDGNAENGAASDEEEVVDAEVVDEDGK